jgi:hypothetical protein
MMNENQLFEVQAVARVRLHSCSFVATKARLSASENFNPQAAQRLDWCRMQGRVRRAYSI